MTMSNIFVFIRIIANNMISLQAQTIHLPSSVIIYYYFQPRNDNIVDNDCLLLVFKSLAEIQFLCKNRNIIHNIYIYMCMHIYIK